eukprot:747415-Hanusia_phi.AAC.10
MAGEYIYSRPSVLVVDKGGNRIWNITYSSAADFPTPRRYIFVKVEVFKRSLNQIERTEASNSSILQSSVQSGLAEFARIQINEYD